MLGLAQPTRWPCPRCHITVVPRVATQHLHAAIVRAQERHAAMHARSLAAALQRGAA